MTTRSPTARQPLDVGGEALPAPRELVGPGAVDLADEALEPRAQRERAGHRLRRRALAVARVEVVDLVVVLVDLAQQVGDGQGAGEALGAAPDGAPLPGHDPAEVVDVVLPGAGPVRLEEQPAGLPRAAAASSVRGR